MAERRRTRPQLRFRYPPNSPLDTDAHAELIRRLQDGAWVIEPDPEQAGRLEDEYYSDVWKIDIPQSNGSRELHVPWDRWSAFAAIEFERIRFVDGFEAIWHDATQTVEASVSPGIRMSTRRPHPIWASPDTSTDPVKAEEERSVFYQFQDGEGDLRLLFPEGQMIRFQGPEATIELSAPSRAFTSFFDVGLDEPLATLKVTVAAVHEAPAALLRGVASDFLFELDMRTGWGLQLAAVPTEAVTAAPTPDDLRMRYPSARYRPDAKSLYWYAASNSRLPLAQYVAYYQVLEHFFGSFSQRLAIERAKSTLRDPTFDRSDSEAVHNLLADAASSFVASTKEHVQLRSVLQACVSAPELRRFITSDEARHASLTKEHLEAVPRVVADESEERLWESVTQHVYKLRNRIVHKKQHDAPSAIGLLLPNSPDEGLLGHDIQLVRWLAQKAIVHDGS